MPDDDLLGFLLGCGCEARCCCGQSAPAPVARPSGLFQQAGRGQEPPRLPDESPFIPPVRLATMHALGALLLSPHTRPPLPHAPVWDRGDGVTGPLYPEVPTGQEHPPRVLLGTPGTTPPDTPELTTLAHLRDALRDPLMPYAAGIRDGRVYVRVHDLPAWGHHLRRVDGSDWPDDGATVWVWQRSLATDYRANDPDSIEVTAQEIDPDIPIIIAGEHAQEDGRLLYQTRQVRPQLAAGPWRDVYGAHLTPQGASVTRVYLDGEVQVEDRALPVVDVTLRVPDVTVTRTLAYNRVVDGVGVSNVGYAAQVALTSGPTPHQRPGEPAYLAQVGRITWNDPDPRPSFVLLVSGGVPYVEVTRLPGAPPSLDKLTPLAVPGRNVRARFIPDGDGLPLADARDAPPQALLAGAVVYEGPLGTLPAPCSGLSAAWAGLEVQAGGHFTADAWEDASHRWACQVTADAVHVARTPLRPPDGQPPVTRHWTFPAPAELPEGTPVLSYAFLREGQGWPTRAGLLAWVDAEGTLTRVSVRARRAGDATPGTQPVTFEVWPALPARPDPRDVTLTHAGTLTPPDAATLGGAPTPLLSRWHLPAPGEPGGERPHLPTVTGALALTWADPTGTGRARLARVTLLTTRAAADDLGAQLALPPGWAVRADPAGAYVRLTLTPAAPAPLTLTLAASALPAGHPRATLEATPDEN